MPLQEINLGQRKPELKKLLLIGQEGSGKTHFIASMPKPIYIFSFDKGIDTLAGIEGITAAVCMDENRYKPHAFLDFKQKFDELKNAKAEYTWKDGRKEKYKTLAVDSLTALSKAIFDHEQNINNTIDKPAGYGPYMNTKSKLQDIVTQGVYIADHFICTALIEPTKDEITGEIFFTPSTEGKFREEAGQWFDAVFFMSVDKDLQGNRKYKMLTVGDRRQKAKIRLPSTIGNVVAAIEEPSYSALINKIDIALAESQKLNQGGK